MISDAAPHLKTLLFVELSNRLAERRAGKLVPFQLRRSLRNIFCVATAKKLLATIWLSSRPAAHRLPDRQRALLYASRFLVEVRKFQCISCDRRKSEQLVRGHGLATNRDPDQPQNSQLRPHRRFRMSAVSSTATNNDRSDSSRVRSPRPP
ncbi:MAG: hypothetical protein JWM11_1086 [Planctomycetaceae bacterium]|nr:hypothetical protein [Planctomycetaceae bacterium]